jgi:hypothetical protein
MNRVIECIRVNRWDSAAIRGIRTPGDVLFLKVQIEEKFIFFHVFIEDSYEETHRI